MGSTPSVGRTSLGAEIGSGKGSEAKDAPRLFASLVGAADQRCKRTVVAVGIDPVDALVLDSADAPKGSSSSLFPL
ncbi:MAG TPA: hypothetical protein VF207_05785, partial [Chthoniobacterales bacterium]